MLKQNTTSLTFNDIPQVMSEVLDELRFLKQEVEKINLQPKSKNARTPVSTERAAELTGLAKTTLYRYTAQGLIPCYKKGKCLMFYEDELEVCGVRPDVHRHPSRIPERLARSSGRHHSGALP